MVDELDVLRAFGNAPDPDHTLRHDALANIHRGLELTRPHRMMILSAAALVLIAGVVGLGVLRSADVHTKASNAPAAMGPQRVQGGPIKEPNTPAWEGTNNIWGLQQAPGGSPFVNGVKYTSIASAETAAQMVIPRPNDPLANDQMITDVWVALPLHPHNNPPSAQIMIDYSNGVSVELAKAGSFLLGPGELQKKYEAMAKEDAYSTGGKAEVTTVNGQPAYLIPENAAQYANGQSQGNAGWVEIVYDGQVIDISGHLPSADLLRIASSVSLPR